jgi:hypothetical protein
MTIRINLWKLITLVVLVVALLLAPMAMAQVQLVNYRYTNNGELSVLQYPSYNAPVVRTIPAGQTVTLLQPFTQEGLLWYAPINAQNTEWVIFASVGSCEMYPFGSMTPQ